MGMSDQVYVSVVTPMYNEKDCIEEFHARAKAALEALGKPYEIILVDDGSSDGSDEIIRALCDRDEAVVGVFLSRNRGQSAAIYAGIQHSSGDNVAILDGDLQNPPEEIGLLLAEMEKGCDMAKGIRTGRTESALLRKVPSRIANYLIRRVTKCDVKDMGGPSCIRGDVARGLRLRSGQHRFIPAIVHSAGGRVVEVPTTSHKRFAGKSHYGIGRTFDVMFDILMLWFQSSSKQRPIYLFGRLSVFSLLASAALFCWTLFDKVFRGRSIADRPPFFIAILLLLSGLSILFTGFTLELVSYISGVTTENKPYIVRETRNYESRGRR